MCVESTEQPSAPPEPALPPAPPEPDIPPVELEPDGPAPLGGLEALLPFAASEVEKSLAGGSHPSQRLRINMDTSDT
jgi:hypothetical protein